MSVALMYIDADTDMNSPVDADWNGYFASMTMTQLMARPGAIIDTETDPVLSGEKLCDDANTVFFGTNLLHPGNKREHLEYLNDEHFKVISSKVVAAHPEACAYEALQHLERNQLDAFWVHFDVDAIDPGEFLLANIPNFTGVKFEKMMQALEVFMARDRIVGLTVTEVNPDHDPDLTMTTRLTNGVVAMLGRRERLNSSKEFRTVARH